MNALVLESAWSAYQDRLGNLTAREEAMIERAFRAGWAAARASQPKKPLNPLPDRSLQLR